MTSQGLQPEKTVSSDLIYRGRVINLRVETIALTDGRTTTREIVEHRGAVAVVAVDEADNVLLVRQFRTAAGRELLEIPAGTLEAGEEPIRCAKRELGEETGFRASRWKRLGGFFSAPGFSTEFLHLYLARGLRPGTAQTEEDEQIVLCKLPFAQALTLVSSGEICDAKSIVGLLMAARSFGR